MKDGSLVSEEPDKDAYIKELLNFRNVYVNTPVLYGMVDTDKDAQSGTENEIQLLAISFSDKKLSIFQLDIINPEYKADGNQLTVKFQRDLTYTFEKLENGNIKDKFENELELMEE
ncbi:hypothetical protein JDW15_10090 [Aerococcaceae bacterium zg-ZJ1578]|uniref:hypothetical protein n=1 Tax=Aerococcaceae bacterium zg-252 TaxID=2796928 RepID=UPI001A212205|nr:hypothetical protein [Aerococcaceae bacterium zg-1578]